MLLTAVGFPGVGDPVEAEPFEGTRLLNDAGVAYGLVVVPVLVVPFSESELKEALVVPAAGLAVA